MHPFSATLVALNVAFAYMSVARGQYLAACLSMGAALALTWVEGYAKK